jgi:tetratricopeptide (TPR) repeat protein
MAANRSKTAKNVENFFISGNAFYDQGKYQEAIEDFNKALELDPKFAKAYNNRGNAFHVQGKYQEAIEDYNKALELDTKFAKAYYNRGAAFYDQGKYQEAIEDCNKALELDTKNAATYNNLKILLSNSVFQGNRAAPRKHDELDKPESAIGMHNTL